MSTTTAADQHAKLPLDAQWAISYAAAKVPVSATEDSIIQSGISWGVIVVVGDTTVLTKHGDALMRAGIAAKDELNAERDGKALTLAGQKAGEYLDSLGTTDVGTLDGDQWEKFCGLMVATYIHFRNAA